MSLLFNTNNNLDEVVFEQRNKAYGAYAIRKAYPNHVNKSLLFTFLPLAILLVASIIYGKFNKPFLVEPILAHAKEAAQKIKEVEVNLENLFIETSSAKTVVTDNNNYKIVKKQQAVVPLKTNHITTQPIATSKIGNGLGTLPNIGPISGNVTKGNGFPVLEPTNNIVDIAEFMPEFPGGLDAFYRYIQKHLNFPKNAIDLGINGKVVVSFVVLQNGQIGEVALERGIGFGCDEEALRVIENMPAWNPGIQNGKKVAVKMRLPIKFESKF